MTIDVYLSVFTLMLISLGINVLSIKTRIPYTVLLVIAGAFLVPLSDIDALSFITSFQLTPELLFFIFLPILIFESAYNMNVRHIKDNKFAISVLAIFGLLISTFFIGFTGHWVFGLLGLQIPLIITLLFGAIISATDPVAVLALFKECGAPHRLTLIFEGESLFNDGTAFAMFLVFLEIMQHGYHGTPTILQGLFQFSTMILGGMLFGLLMGFLFSKLIEFIRGNEHLEITLTLLVAHFTFLLAELISEKWIVAGHQIHISSIIATLFASMVIGNYGRFKMSIEVEAYMEKFWGYFAFIANSLVFILMGLLFANLSIALHVALMPIFIMVVVVAIARAVSIYVSVGLVNRIKSEESIPMSWQHLMSWGSLRGSIAIIMVLLIPDDVSLPGWKYEFSIKEFILAITIGSIYFTLFVKAPTINKLVRWLKIDALLAHEEMSYFKSKALIYQELQDRSEELFKQHYISKSQYDALKKDYQKLYQKIISQEKAVSSSHVIENMLRIYTLAIQKKALKEMFRCNEITENIYTKNLNILEIQAERVVNDQPKLESLNAYFTTWAGFLKNSALRRIFFLGAQQNTPEERYLYYRTQYKLINNVLHDLSELEHTALFEIFNEPKAIKNVTAIYLSLKSKTIQQMQQEIQSNQDLLDNLNIHTAESLLQASQKDTLKELLENEIISAKLYILLNKEFER